MNDINIRNIFVVCFSILILCYSDIAKPETNEIEDEEYKVYNSIIDSRRFSTEKNIIISRNILYVDPQSKLLHNSFNRILKRFPELFMDILDKNRKNHKFTNKFFAGRTYTIWKDDDYSSYSKEYPNSSLHIFSRVGFNKSKNKALVYI